MSKEEFLAYVNRGKAQKPKHPENLRMPYVSSKKPLAASVDWRSNAVSEVKDQGQCGSCWSFSTTGAIEGQLALQRGRLTSLSEQNLIDCSSSYGNAGCDGGWMDSAFSYIHDYGIMSESAYPYEAQGDYCRFDSSQSVTTLSGYYDLPSGGENSLADAVGQAGPVAVAIDATDELQFYSGGLFYDQTCNQSDLNHGVLVVGYGSDNGHWGSNAVSEVKDQGQCGSCWSFSTTGAIEGQLALQRGRLTSLSEQNLIDCSSSYGNAGCDGGWMDSAFSYIPDYGIMSEFAYPYEAQGDYCRFDSSQFVTTLSGYYDLPSGGENSLADAVGQAGPVAVAIDAPDELQFYSGGLFYDQTCNQSDLNHGVFVVGYGSDNGQDYWILKNSWGFGWGESGYWRQVRNYGNNCGIATAASYPAL
uniref:Putative cathepsin L-like proteinase n=1 Tax=Tenebrio molitor TaxID=7067 RepID=A1XG96_TENMO|nr:putative cathepsin L-like proteinase [Tenebrio molitor]